MIQLDHGEIIWKSGKSTGEIMNNHGKASRNGLFCMAMLLTSRECKQQNVWTMPSGDNAIAALMIDRDRPQQVRSMIWFIANLGVNIPQYRDGPEGRRMFP